MIMQSKYKRSACKNKSENFITYLCDKTFLKLWVYPNVYKKTGKEFCDCLVLFEDNILIFSVKDYKYKGKTQQIAWQRWKRGTIDESIKQINGAERWLKKYPNELYIDEKCTKKIPIKFDISKAKIYRFVIALGLNEDIGILYSNDNEHNNLDNKIGVFQTSKDKIYHILDSANVELVLKELDTIQDFLDFYDEKELTISQLEKIGYYGESTLLALYMQNMNEVTGEHKILPPNFKNGEVLIKENLWANIENDPQYTKKKIEDEFSYLVDNLLNKSIYYEQRGELIGNVDVQNGFSPIKEIAKESRFQRRILGNTLWDVFLKYWTLEKQKRFVRFSMSENGNKAYVILISTFTNDKDIENSRIQLRKMLEIACGSLKNIKPELIQIIGIAIIPHKELFSIGEDYILLNCKDWDEEHINFYNECNESYRFWKQNIKSKVVSFDEYPQIS